MQKGFIDTECPKCKRRIGWFGTILEHPGCKICGWAPDRESLAEDAAALEEAMEKARRRVLAEDPCNAVDAPVDGMEPRTLQRPVDGVLGPFEPKKPEPMSPEATPDEEAP